MIKNEELKIMAGGGVEEWSKIQNEGTVGREELKNEGKSKMKIRWEGWSWRMKGMKNEGTVGREEGKKKEGKVEEVMKGRGKRMKREGK